MAILNLSITVADDEVQEILTEFTDFHGYQAQVFDESAGEMVANPQSQEEFMKLVIIEYIKASIKTHREREAIATVANIDDIEMS